MTCATMPTVRKLGRKPPAVSVDGLVDRLGGGACPQEEARLATGPLLAAIEHAESLLCVPLSEVQYEQVWPGYPGTSLRLRYSPVIYVEEVAYSDNDGVDWCDVDQGLYYDDLHANPPALQLKCGCSWPGNCCCSCVTDCNSCCCGLMVRVRYTAGYSCEDHIPARIRQAVKMLGEYYEFGEDARIRDSANMILRSMARRGVAGVM